MHLATPRAFDTGVVATAWKPIGASFEFENRATLVTVGFYLSEEAMADGVRPLATETVRFDSDSTDAVLAGSGVDLLALVMGLLASRDAFAPPA